MDKNLFQHKMSEHDETAKSRGDLLAQITQARDYAESIIALMPSGLLAIDYDGYIRTWNPEVERISGYRREDV